MANLYFTNASEDLNWETLTNWNTAADGSGDNPTNIPWTDDGSGGAWYGDYDLVDASGGYLNIANTTTLSTEVTGTCNISNVYCLGIINAGTWTGDYVYASADVGIGRGIINGGTFTGDYCGTDPDIGGDGPGLVTGGIWNGLDFLNMGMISGGVFNGANINNASFISGGQFYGDNFQNWANLTAVLGYISGGQFYNNGFSNYLGVFSGALFDGSNFDNSYGKVSGADIRGTFSNGSFDPNYFDFTPWGQISETYFSGPSTGTTSGPLGPNYVYADGVMAIQYPAPSGGGGNPMISRLLNLPWFINI